MFLLAVVLTAPRTIRRRALRTTKVIADGKTGARPGRVGINADWPVNKRSSLFSVKPRTGGKDSTRFPSLHRMGRGIKGEGKGVMNLMAHEHSFDAAQQGSVTGGCVLIMHSLIQWQCPFPSPDFHHIRNTHHQALLGRIKRVFVSHQIHHAFPLTLIPAPLPKGRGRP